MNILDKLLQVETKDRNIVQIILWWELRRILYNIIVLIAGIISLFLMLFFASNKIKLEAGEDFIEPISFIIFAFLSNVFYTLGWITEIFTERSLDYGRKMFKTGLYFTLICMFIPPLIWFFIYLIG
jgi:magnesium-transporting ATPase (P-type)